MTKLRSLYLGMPVRAVAGICAIFAICIVAGCGGGESEIAIVSRDTGIRFSANARIEQYDGLDPLGVDGPVAYFKILTDRAGFKKTVATLPKTSHDWKKNRFDGNDWSRLSSKDRLGISNTCNGFPGDMTVLGPPPSWWQPDSLNKFVASAGYKFKRWWSLIGGQDDSGQYVIYVYSYDL